VAAVGALVFAVMLSACADNSACRSGSTVPMASGKGSIVGCGGPYDEIYREIYTPGRGTDLGA